MRPFHVPDFPVGGASVQILNRQFEMGQRQPVFLALEFR